MHLNYVGCVSCVQVTIPNTISLLHDSTWNNLQKQQFAHSSNSLPCFLQTMLILHTCASIVEYLAICVCIVE